VANLVVYVEMPFRDIIAYIQHAGARIAPYEPRHADYYLQDTTMKVTPYGFEAFQRFALMWLSATRRAGLVTKSRSAPQSARPYPRAFRRHAWLAWAQVIDRIQDPTKLSRYSSYSANCEPFGNVA
jgi:hypothetical protein